LGARPLLERSLAFALQRGDRRIPFRELRGQFAQAGVELSALPAHALERLRQRGDLRALRFHAQRQRMRRVAGLACGGAGVVARLVQGGAFAVQRPARILERGHARHRRFQAAARLARLRRAGFQRLGKLRQFVVDLLDASTRRVQPALLPLQLATEFGDAAVGQVQRALRVLAVLLGDQRAVAPGRKATLEFGFAVLQFLDLAAQFLDLALAQQRALLGGARAQHPHPAGADALAVAGDDRFAIAQPRQQGPRVGEGVGGVELGQDAQDRGRALYLGRQRSRRMLDAAGIGRHQGEPAFAQLAQRVDQGLRRLDQHAFDQLSERALYRVFPARLDDELLAHARGRIQATLAKPFDRRALFLAQRRVLQRFQRRQATALFLRLLAHFGQFRLRIALLVLQLGDGLLACLDL